MANISLIGGLNRVEAPFIKITIGDYTFGVYNKEAGTLLSNGFYQTSKIVYPNFVKSLTIDKINGQVNQYSLSLVYPITPSDDPNFFEKVFSSVSKTRKIVFTYGDASLPNYIYKNEEAIITSVRSSFSMKSSTISYEVTAVSRAMLASSGCYTFVNTGNKKPSDEIKRILYDKTYGLQQIFTGMSRPEYVELAGLIPGNDQEVPLDTKSNISVLDYLKYLVDCMIPEGVPYNNNKQKSFYILTIVDIISGELNLGRITADELGGPFFRIMRVDKDIDNSDAYDLDIGFPSNNIITSFEINNNENYSIFYDWQKELIPTDYVLRLDDAGQWEEIYAPTISSDNDEYRTRVEDSTWWSKLTEFPITVRLTVKGLIRPAILMTHVRLKVYYYGKKHISSGLYIITKQTDSISSGGYRTSLTLTRVRGDTD